MSGASGIDTGQLGPLDDDTKREHRAAITCASRILAEGGSPDDLLELLRAIGLAHDPHARDRDPLAATYRVGHLRGPQQ